MCHAFMGYSYSLRSNFIDTCSEPKAISQETFPSFRCSKATHFLAIDYWACSAYPPTIAACHPSDTQIILARAVVRTSNALRLRDTAVADVSLSQTIIGASELSP
jgi:hypothetical protein